MIRIVIILGSTRQNRKTDQVAYYLRDQLTNRKDISVELIDLAEIQIPIFEERWQESNDPPELMHSISLTLSQADALIFCSPEYHGSYTGALKNALDHFWKEFKRKPIGVVTSGSGKMGGINASTQMQLLILSLSAFPMPYKLLVPYVHKAFDESGNPVDPALETQTNQFIDEFLWFSEKFVKTPNISTQASSFD